MSKPNRTRDPGKIAAMHRTQPTHVAASVQQAIQRDPLQAMPGDEAAQRKHPVMHAIDLLINYDGNNEQAFNPEAYHEAGRQLQTYHAEQMGALQQASGRAEESTRQLSELIEDVAEMLDFDLTDRTAGEMLEVLRDRLNPPEPLIVDLDKLPKDFDENLWQQLQREANNTPIGVHEENHRPVTPNEHAAIKNMHDICAVLAKHFEDDPAVTFENAAGLVGSIIGDFEESEHLRKYHEKHVEQLRDNLRERGGVTSPNPQEAEELEAMRETLKALAPLLGLRDDVKDRADLNRIIGKVRSLIENQQPEGWAENAQILVESNKRYENALAAMRNVMSLV